LIDYLLRRLPPAAFTLISLLLMPPAAASIPLYADFVTLYFLHYASLDCFTARALFRCSPARYFSAIF